MFSLGYQEMILVGVVALVVIGPEKIPGVLRRLGEYSAILRRYAEDVKRQMELAEADTLARGEDAGSMSGKASREPREGMDATTVRRASPQDFAKNDVSAVPSSPAEDLPKST
ncbi:MAG: twin-arginine translocase TatA/TatE family subunit [Candidatus Hydrogenedentota bacterium]